MQEFQSQICQPQEKNHAMIRSQISHIHVFMTVKRIPHYTSLTSSPSPVHATMISCCVEQIIPSIIVKSEMLTG